MALWRNQLELYMNPSPYDDSQLKRTDTTSTTPKPGEASLSAPVIGSSSSSSPPFEQAGSEVSAASHNCVGPNSIEPASLTECAIEHTRCDLSAVIVERRMHEIAKHLIAYLGINEVADSHFPAGNFRSDQDGVSAYDKTTNTVTIFRNHFSDGHMMGEILSEWLYEQCQLLRTDKPEREDSQCVEVGPRWAYFRRYVGRDLARMACDDYEIAKLFDPLCRPAPDRHAELTPEQKQTRAAIQLLEYKILNLNESLMELERALSSVSSEFSISAQALESLPQEEHRESLSALIVDSSNQAIAALDKILAETPGLLPSDDTPPLIDTSVLSLRLCRDLRQEIKRLGELFDAVRSALLTQLSGGDGDGGPIDTLLRQKSPPAGWQSWLDWNVLHAKELSDIFTRLRQLLMFEERNCRPELFGYALAGAWMRNRFNPGTNAAIIFRLSVDEIQAEYFHSNTTNRNTAPTSDLESSGEILA